MYNSIILSTFFISWSIERIYYYFYHKKENDSLLNLNTPLDSSSQASYYEINSLNNQSNNSDNTNISNNQDKEPKNETLL